MTFLDNTPVGKSITRTNQKKIHHILSSVLDQQLLPFENEFVRNEAFKPVSWCHQSNTRALLVLANQNCTRVSNALYWLPEPAPRVPVTCRWCHFYKLQRWQLICWEYRPWNHLLNVSKRDFLKKGEALCWKLFTNLEEYRKSLLHTCSLCFFARGW